MSAQFNPITGAAYPASVVSRKRVQANFTRPSDATAYAAGDVVGPVTTPAVMTLSDCARKNGGTGRIVGVLLECNLATVTNGTFTVHFFNASFTPAADNAAFASLHGQRATWQGHVNLPILVADAAGAGAAYTRIDDDFGGGDDGLPLLFQCATGNDDLFAVIVASAAYTPSSAEVFTLTVFVEQD